MVYDLSSRLDELAERLELLEYEIADKDTFRELESRVYKLENDVSYRDVYIYFTVF